VKVEDVEGLCGDDTCRARVGGPVQPGDDPLVSDPCPVCAAAATAALVAAQEGRGG
jgi:hypothetical protein